MITEAIHKLRSISHAAKEGHLQQKHIGEAIDAWIRDYTDIASINIKEYHPSDDNHRNFLIEKAKHELGFKLADMANIYPDFEKTDYGLECRMSVLYFKGAHNLK